MDAELTDLTLDSVVEVILDMVAVSSGVAEAEATEAIGDGGGKFRTQPATAGDHRVSSIPGRAEWSFQNGTA